MTTEPMLPLRSFFRETPVTPALKKPEHMEQALAAHGKIVYLLTGNPENCESLIQRVLAGGKLPIVNLDLLNGLSRDKFAVNFLKRCGARGIISTHQEPLRHARVIGLYAIQRMFLLDSGAMDSISSQLRNTLVDAIEIMPAIVAPLILERVRGISAEVSVVGGGLVLSLKEADDLLSRGLDAVSISNPEMWIP